MSGFLARYVSLAALHASRHAAPGSPLKPLTYHVFVSIPSRSFYIHPSPKHRKQKTHLDPPPIRHAPPHAPQSGNINDLLMPRKQHAHRRAATLILRPGSATHLREAGRLRRQTRASRSLAGAGAGSSHAFVPAHAEISPGFHTHKAITPNASLRTHSKEKARCSAKVVEKIEGQRTDTSSTHPAPRRRPRCQRFAAAWASSRSPARPAAPPSRSSDAPP